MNELWRASWWFTHAYGASCSRRSFLRGMMFCAKPLSSHPPVSRRPFVPLPTAHAQHGTTGFVAQAWRAHVPSPVADTNSPRSMCGESAPLFFLRVCVHPWPPIVAAPRVACASAPPTAADATELPRALSLCECARSIRIAAYACNLPPIPSLCPLRCQFRAHVAHRHLSARLGFGTGLRDG